MEHMEENKIRVDEETRKKANRYFFTKVLVNLVLVIIGALFIALFMRQMQAKTALVKQEETSKLALDEAVMSLEKNEQDAGDLALIFHDSNQDVLGDMSRLFSSGLFESLADADNTERSAMFADMVERSGVQYLFLMSPDGKIALSPEASLYGVNPAARAYMTQENVNDILKGAKDSEGNVTPVTVKNQYGTYFFYSTPYTYKDITYYLVLGTDASVLDVQMASLTDVSVVLSRVAVGKGGFVFAVNKEDGTFLYYKNGEEILTGQSALACGLSEAALEDGYSGIETIKGTRYYCVSKDYGDRTMISAVVQTSNLYRNDTYALFWSILGFVLIMLVCLAYAVIVRNDFVSREVKTERQILNPNSSNPTIFDRSILKKVLPLLIAGVLVMYGISFYTQTMLEITEGIEKSDIALDEISGRYQESLTNRELIEDYYNNRSLAKARLIAFLIEEDPSLLNANSEFYHNYYDDKGDKKFITDDEGNHLKSISESAKLQELCDVNDIDSIYVFDESGHTIGTNTPNWFFTVSHNEEDQSYPFLQILDGRLDSYVQEAMTNDLDEATQFIGVAFKYYTRKDANGNTEYVSSFEYDKNKEGITVHRAMVQVGLDADTSAKLLESTDVANILSTNMLTDGFIVMFDSTDDHLCTYSPVDVSIGQSAKELGVSPNAFTGDDYYGFAKINGVKYFSCFRYADDYFIGTALPTSGMYRARGTISLITALVCFLLILILTGTVTLTNEEEEQLYEVMSEDREKRGINSAIFNIVLPSGKSASTVKAAARWDNRRITWGEKNPEQKLGTILGVIGTVLMVYVIIVAAGADRIFDENSIVRYILSDTWDRGSNIFAWTMCVLVLLTIALGVELFRIPVRLSTALLGARGETVGHLLISVVKYGGTLVAVFYCLYLLGIDSTRLLASAGILSLVIGLGAQSLIKDIIAGIFIVFEGEFRVGDIVTIGDYRGTVMDIGLRTTKILGADGNIKIYNNSEISGVLNMTQEASWAMTNIDIEYGQDLNYVEEVLNRELPKLRKANPLITGGPTYLGVQNLKDSGVELLVACNCNEKDILGVRRFLNKSVLQIFYDNDINVPFPNVTISTLEKEEKKSFDELLEEKKKKDKKKNILE
ncbi:MAG: mechanosensitive ion channel family protein [Mogibacterium sp.]|nr:mechanosensitive ion channel family protein [Mogibacterium sp.]